MERGYHVSFAPSILLLPRFAEPRMEDQRANRVNARFRTSRDHRKRFCERVFERPAI
jgi:hypothetical protein